MLWCVFSPVSPACHLAHLVKSLDTQMKERSADPVLSRDDGISLSFYPLRAQTETWVASEAAHPPAGPGQPTSPPRKVLKGRVTGMV